MPNPKLLVNPEGLEAQFRLVPKNDEKEEGELEDDDDDEEAENESERNGATDGKSLGVDRDEGYAGGDNEKKKSKPTISLFEMQSFLIALMLPEPRLSNPPTWCRVIRCMRASNVGVFLLDDEDEELLWVGDKAEKFTHGFRFETSPDWIERLTNIPLSRRLNNFNDSEHENRRRSSSYVTNLNSIPKISRTSLLLSPLQQIIEKYPMPTDEEIRVLRSRYSKVDDRSPIFAIDCEMCITSRNRSELTRISIVDEENRVVYNELVKPKARITNYLTRYSGITPEMMENVTNTLEDVQEYIRETLPRDSIFVGHSLNMDLLAIKIFHPYVIDTSVIYNRSGVRYHKPSLKSLAFEFLGRTIQRADKIGHDSLEDAITAMDLVRLKLVNGLTFGDEVARQKQLGLKFDSKTGITHLQFDRFIERHNVTNVSYRCLDTTPGARCFYIHEREGPPELEVKEAILSLLDKGRNSICVVLTSSGVCYVKI